MSEEVIASRDADDVDPDPYMLREAREALRALMRGDMHRATVGPPWGTTLQRLDNDRAMLTWAALCMAGVFAQRLAQDYNVTVDVILDGYQSAVPKGFGTDLTVSPKKLVSTVREMVRDGDNRIVRTVDL